MQSRGKGCTIFQVVGKQDFAELPVVVSLRPPAARPGGWVGANFGEQSTCDGIIVGYSCHQTHAQLVVVFVPATPCELASENF